MIEPDAVSIARMYPRHLDVAWYYPASLNMAFCEP